MLSLSQPWFPVISSAIINGIPITNWPFCWLDISNLPNQFQRRKMPNLPPSCELSFQSPCRYIWIHERALSIRAYILTAITFVLKSHWWFSFKAQLRSYWKPIPRNPTCNLSLKIKINLNYWINLIEFRMNCFNHFLNFINILLLRSEPIKRPFLVNERVRF